MNKEVEAKVKALFPENIEGIYISKNDYDRLCGDLTLENAELKQEIKRLHNIIKEARKCVKRNCILSDCWMEIGFCNFVPIGKSKYKPLPIKKVKELFEILDEENSK